MLLAADDLAGLAAASVDKGGPPAETGEAELGPGVGNWRSLGEAAARVLNRVRASSRLTGNESGQASRRAGRIESFIDPTRTLAGQAYPPYKSVDDANGDSMQTIGAARMVAIMLAGLAHEREDRGEALIGYIEAEAGYLAADMDLAGLTMLAVCADAREMRDAFTPQAA